MIEETGHFTEEVATALEHAATLSEIDDIYRPYRPKRKTRASIAKAKGLEPLADLLLEQNPGLIPCRKRQLIAVTNGGCNGRRRFSRRPRYPGRKDVRRSEYS